MKWSEFLHEICLLILLNRFNGDVTFSQVRRASIPGHLSNEMKVLPATFPSIERDFSRRFSLARSDTLARPIFPNTSCDELFSKHAKVLEKLNQRNRLEQLKRKQMGSSLNFTIVENFDGQENINLPKLKLNARDDRRAVTDPWTSVNEMQRLRHEPIPVKITRLKI